MPLVALTRSLRAAEMGREAGVGVAHMMRGHDAQHDFGIGQGFSGVAGYGDGGGQWESGKKGGVFSGRADGCSDYSGVGPESDTVASALREIESERGAPCASAHDCDIAHGWVALFLPKRYSVPLRRRAMFW